VTAPPTPRLLVVDDEVAHMQALCSTLEQEGYVTRGFTSGHEATAALRGESFDLLLTDLMMPQIDGISLLRACREIDPDLACIVMTGHGTIATAVDALKAGAVDYVQKPFKVKSILPVLARALAMRGLQLENIQLRESVSIYELARAITHGLEHDEVVERTLGAASRQDDVDAVYLLEPVTQAGELCLAGAAGPGVQALERTVTIPGAALEQWLAHAQQELEDPGRHAEAGALFAHPFDARIGVAIPIVSGGRFFGVLGFSSARQRHGVRPGQLKALDVLARTAATAFATAGLVAELRRMNEELEQRVRERTRELEGANKDLESFAYSVSHDLREPLRAVGGFCEMFRTEFGASVPEAGRKILERIWQGAGRMNQLIDDLLHFSRFSREPLHCLPVALRELALQVVQRLKERLGDRRIEVEVGELPDCYADPALLEQVLVNLLSNAFKFTAGREVARVEVGVLRQAETIVYYVRDNGAGFDMRAADKLFGVFQRLHSQEAFEGTGIGLSIVHRIITRHGGRVWADGRPDEGATFYFSLPGPAHINAWRNVKSVPGGLRHSGA
jgi:signal transduction histidine kinase/CheY-like chemotaxis protein